MTQPTSDDGAPDDGAPDDWNPDDWNPDDPECDSVFYDVSDWSISQQAEVSAVFADRGIRHAWRGFEIAVPEHQEADADAAFEELERRLGLSDEPAPTGPVVLADGEPLMEYDLDAWSPGERATLTTALVDARVPHRWEGAQLVVPVAAEEFVDELLDAVETGDVMLIDADDDEPTVTLDELAAIARRLAKEPRSTEARTRLAEVVEELDPERPPFGVQLALWRRSGVLCGQMLDELARSQPDEISVVDAAEELDRLVRPLI